MRIRNTTRKTTRRKKNTCTVSSCVSWYCDIEGISIEPTEEEIQNDPQRIKAEKEAAAKAQAAKEKEEKTARLAAAAPRLKEIAELVAKSEETTGSGGCCLAWKEGAAELLVHHGFLISHSTERSVVKTYDDGSKATHGRILHDAALAKEVLALAEINIGH